MATIPTCNLCRWSKGRTGVCSEDGILEPGTYTLTVNALTQIFPYGSDTGGSSRFDIDFFLETPVAIDQMAWVQVKALFR